MACPCCQRYGYCCVLEECRSARSKKQCEEEYFGTWLGYDIACTPVCDPWPGTVIVTLTGIETTLNPQSPDGQTEYVPGSGEQFNGTYIFDFSPMGRCMWEQGRKHAIDRRVFFPNGLWILERYFLSIAQYATGELAALALYPENLYYRHEAFWALAFDIADEWPPAPASECVTNPITNASPDYTSVIFNRSDRPRQWLIGPVNLDNCKATVVYA